MIGRLGIWFLAVMLGWNTGAGAVPPGFQETRIAGPENAACTQARLTPPQALCGSPPGTEGLQFWLVSSPMGVNLLPLGSLVTLCWHAQNVESLELQGPLPGGVSVCPLGGGVQVSGSLTLPLVTLATYRLEAQQGQERLSQTLSVDVLSIEKYASLEILTGVVWPQSELKVRWSAWGNLAQQGQLRLVWYDAQGYLQVKLLAPIPPNANWGEVSLDVGAFVPGHNIIRLELGRSAIERRFFFVPVASWEKKPGVWLEEGLQVLQAQEKEVLALYPQKMDAWKYGASRFELKRGLKKLGTSSVKIEAQKLFLQPPQENSFIVIVPDTSSTYLKSYLQLLAKERLFYQYTRDYRAIGYLENTLKTFGSVPPETLAHPAWIALSDSAGGRLAVASGSFYRLSKSGAFQEAKIPEEATASLQIKALASLPAQVMKVLEPSHFLLGTEKFIFLFNAGRSLPVLESKAVKLKPYPQQLQMLVYVIAQNTWHNLAQPFDLQERLTTYYQGNLIWAVREKELWYWSMPDADYFLAE